MEKTYDVLLGYRIYRRKLLGAAAVVLLLSVVAIGSMYMFFMNMWMIEDVQKVREQFLQGEVRLQAIENLTGNFIDEIYGRRTLMQDTIALLDSASAQEYLDKRRENSLTGRAQIAYLPGKLGALFQQYRGNVKCVLIYGSGGKKVIWQEKSSGDIKVSFDFLDSEEWKFLVPYGTMLAASYDIRDPQYLNRSIGRIEFYVDGSTIYNVEDTWIGSWRVSQETQLLEEYLLTEKAGEWLTEAQEQETQEGWLRGDRWNRAYYVKLHSIQGNYDYVVVVDRLGLLKENKTAIFVIVFIILLFAGGAMMYSFFGLREDVRFFGKIAQILEWLQVGEFEEVRRMELPRQYKENEYGMIAESLKKVGLKIEEYIQREYILKLKEQETAMRALQHQINPHFLYNTLETIRSSALTSGDVKTADAIVLLGSLYRARMHSADTISLKEEFELLESYLQIMQLRFGDNFLYQIRLDKEAEEIQTINFWMQPLAENFFTHGFDQKNEFNLLLVNGYMEEDGIRIDIIDNGKGMEPEKIGEILKNMYEGNDDPKADIGLRNVYMRLKYFYGDAFRMELGNNPEGGVGIVIHIPGKEAECIH